ncbi:MAG: HEPN domain-containing protein [Chloroflexota bacterium]
MPELLLEKAERYIRSARLLADDGDLDSAASRLYYMFYITGHLLEAKGLSFSSHRAVISAFGQHFAKTGALDPRFHQALLTGFSQRQLGDYSTGSNLNPSDIDTMVGQAQDFLAAAKEWLAQHPATDA